MHSKVVFHYDTLNLNYVFFFFTVIVLITVSNFSLNAASVEISDEVNFNLETSILHILSVFKVLLDLEQCCRNMFSFIILL